MARISREYKSRVVKVAQEFHKKEPVNNSSDSQPELQIEVPATELPLLLQPAEDPSIPLPIKIYAAPVFQPIIIPSPKKSVKSINEYFDKIFCINLDRRQDRWNLSVSEFSKHGLTVERFSAIDGNNLEGTATLSKWEKACFMSHIAVLRMIIDNNYEKVLILEDDIEFIDKLQEYFIGSAQLIPNNWFMLYLGGNHLNPPVQINLKIGRISKTYTTGAYAITRTMAEAVLKKIERTGIRVQIDVMYSEFHKAGNCYSFVPKIASQRPGFSDIQQGMQDYTSIIK